MGAVAAFKDLCIDAVDAARLGAFWASVLHLELQVDEAGDAKLTGPTSHHTVWINRVPEPKTVKHRVHLDVNAASVADVEAAGAQVLDGDRFPWTVVADPEGGELCVFPREGPIERRLFEIVIDTGPSKEDSHRIAAWWADVLGARLVDDERGFSYVDRIPDAPFESLDFIPVPEPKTVKNRIHLDVTTPDVAALVAAGATILRAPDEEIRWTVLADPDGNEFCAFTERDRPSP